MGGFGAAAMKPSELCTTFPSKSLKDFRESVGEVRSRVGVVARPLVVAQQRREPLTQPGLKGWRRNKGAR
eukprot:1531658-Pyramimonas_sp.AAC.1